MKHTCRCPGEDHLTFGACIRAKGIRVAYCQSAAGRDSTTQKRWDKNLARYAAVRKQGIQPDSTRARDIDRAVTLSDRSGEAYGI